MNPLCPLPRIPGWDVRRDEEGLLVARRVHGLTMYMKRHGALDCVSARDDDELSIVCDAQTHLAERLATAEWLYRRSETFSQPAQT